MHETVGVDGRETIEQRMQQLQDLALGQGAAAFQQAVEAFTLLVLHDHIGAAIGLEDVVYSYDIRVFEARQGARFEDEAFEPGLVFLQQFIAEREYRAVLLPMGELAGQIFLDCDRAMQIVVGGKVSDAESTLAEHALDGVPMQLRAVGQSVAMR